MRGILVESATPPAGAGHPTLGDRIDFCNEYKPWAAGDVGRYEKLFRE